MNRPSRRGIFNIVLALYSSMLLTGCNSEPQSPATDPLITGKIIRPTTESSQDVGNLPMNLALSPDGRYVISSDMGHYEYLWSTRTDTGKGVAHIEFSNTAKAPSTPAGEGDSTKVGTLASNGLYYGLAISRDGVVYAAQGGHDSIAVLKLASDGKLTQDGFITTRPKDFPAGVALDDRGRLYVSNNASGETTDPRKLSGSVAVYDRASKKELGRYTFSASHGGTSNFPLGLTATRDGSKVYVAAERDDAVYVLDTHDPANPSLAATLNTGAHPVTVLLDRDQSHLFVANSLSDTISVVDTKSNRITATILLRPRMAREVPGATPLAMALSPDEKTLYAALGDMNAIAVVDVRDAELSGYIPTGWYPSRFAVTVDGKRLLVANAKGTSVRNPDNKPDPREPKKKLNTLTVLEGNVCAIRIPKNSQLKDATSEVLANNRLNVLEHPAKNPLASIGLASGNITHVIYVIKENRTYDQILGDMPQGNGDPSLVLFGKDITPNQHALAERFVLLDNLYACGEVSGDGWDWSTQGMADAYVVRNIPYNYSHRGRVFDEEGQNNGYPTGGAPATDPAGKPWKERAFQNGIPPIPDVANTGRNIWDTARAAGLSLRNYGFFMDQAGSPAGIVGGPENLPAAIGLAPGGHDLAGITDVDYRRFDLDYGDSDARDFYFKQTGDKSYLMPRAAYGQSHAPSRFNEWNREFQMMLAKDPTGGAVPTLMLIRLPSDHTVGAKSGQHAPQSFVADNDYGLAEIVQSVSKSVIWKHTAIFVIEDDAQSGIDHVDAHRTTAFIISPWIKAHSVDHHFNNTDSMLKTMELLLGLPPLSQYDAVADPILDWDTAPNNAEPFEASMPSKELMIASNPLASSLLWSDPRRRWAIESDKMDFTHADAAPAKELDEITWKIVKGDRSKMPRLRGSTGDDDGD